MIKTQQNPQFNPSVMKKLVETDLYLSFVYADLIKQINDEERVLKILFHSNVIEDSSYLEQYQKLSKYPSSGV